MNLFVFPGGVQNVKVPAFNATSVFVEWDPIPGATIYKLCYREIGGGTVTCMDVDAGLNDKRFRQAIHGLKPGTAYQFSVEGIFPGKFESVIHSSASFNEKTAISIK